MLNVVVSVKTLSVMIFSIMTLSLKVSFLAPSIITFFHYAECRILFIIMLNGTMLSVCYTLFIVMLNGTMLSVIMLSFVMLSVIVPIVLNALASYFN